MDFKAKAQELVSQMTLEEKASLCSGKNFWQTKAVERLNLPAVMVTDGPHGLRKQAGDADHLGISNSVPATCFPAACATASSYDTALLKEVGRAMGEECLQENVAVILGPGANIKRSPLCGRNFEYFSEDPLLGGELAAALINGIQEKGVGTSLKHYAVNNQECRRMTINAVADARALREIYLKSFEIPVRKSKPWTLMCSYNRIDGVYSSDNKWLLTSVLRDEWGFEGLVMTDWGAMNDHVQAILAGLDLEMPGTGGRSDKILIEAVQSGKLKESDVDICAARVAEMILKGRAGQKESFRYDADAHHRLARKAAAESSVLLKNDDAILPLCKGAKLAVIGSFAKKPRYQGAGSSKINPYKIDSALDELEKLGFPASYAQGYDGVHANNGLIDEAVKAAKDADVAVIFAGLPDEYESEGFDRTSMDMPESHTKLIEKVAKANPNTVVVLQLGSPVTTGWAADVKGLLVSYLGGQASSGGAADVLSGNVNPSGKLAESWPAALSDTPCYDFFPGSSKTVEYRESIYVGYRYYDTLDKEVAWPFGYGLSYTTFEYSGLSVKNGDISFSVKNTGQVAGAEAVQIYAGLPASKVFRPKKWLVAFDKVMLEPGKSKTVKISLDSDAFKFYNPAEGKWQTEGGEYAIFVGASVSDIRLTGKTQVQGDKIDSFPTEPDSYRNISGNNWGEADFTALYGRPLPPRERQRKEPYTVNDTLGDIQHTFIGKKIKEGAVKNATETMGTLSDDLKLLIDASLAYMPIRALSMFAGDSLPPDFPNLIVATLNGNFFARTGALLRLLKAMSAAGKK